VDFTPLPPLLLRDDSAGDRSIGVILNSAKLYRIDLHVLYFWSVQKWLAGNYRILSAGWLF
jgi:hypothetical protein